MPRTDQDPYLFSVRKQPANQVRTQVASRTGDQRFTSVHQSAPSLKYDFSILRVMPLNAYRPGRTELLRRLGFL